MRQLKILAIALLAGAGVASAQDAPPPVKLMTAQAGQSGISRVFFGQVVARETVDMAFQVGGQIVELPVVEGTTVASGALIAKLDTEPFELALDQAKLQLDQAQRDLDRLTKLSGAAVSEVTVDDARTAANLARISLRSAERDLNHATLTAPFDALVATRNVANYSTISAGTPVVRLHDMSDVRIDIDVPEILFQRAGRDPDVSFSVTFPANDRSYPLEIREFNAETSQVGQTYTLTLGMEPDEDLSILPGSSATVTAVLREPGARIVLPPAAVVPQAGGGAHVMVFHPGEDEQGTVEKRAVEIEPTTAGEVAVVSGLEPGEEVVAAGASTLQDGMTVRRFGGFPN